MLHILNSDVNVIFTFVFPINNYYESIIMNNMYFKYNRFPPFSISPHFSLHYKDELPNTWDQDQFESNIKNFGL